MEIQIQHLESPITAFDQKEPLVGILSFVRQLDLPRLFKGVAGTEMGPFCWSPWFPEIHLGRFSNREGLTAHHQGHQFTTGRLTWCEMAWGKVYLGIQPKVGCPKKTSKEYAAKYARYSLSTDNIFILAWHKHDLIPIYSTLHVLWVPIPNPDRPWVTWQGMGQMIPKQDSFSKQKLLLGNFFK